MVFWRGFRGTSFDSKEVPPNAPPPAVDEWRAMARRDWQPVTQSDWLDAASPSMRHSSAALLSAALYGRTAVAIERGCVPAGGCASSVNPPVTA